MENEDHHSLKYQIYHYLENHGWEAYVEKKIRLYDKENRIGCRIWADVFAVKDGKSYICEVGQVSGEERIEIFEEYFDIVDHLPIGRKSYRRINEKDWSKFCKMEIPLTQRDVFSDNYNLVKRF